MRLKFLFFPIILVISVSIFIAYIWPEIQNVRSINEEYLSSQQSLKDLQIKQSLMDSMGDQISKNQQDQQLVYNYVPKVRNEEQIINGINYLATDASVSLINLSIADQSILQSASGTNATLQPASSTTPPNAAASQQKIMEATMNVSGNYAQIKMFLSELERIPLVNTVKSASITKDISQLASEDASKSAGNDSLSAVIVVDFTYFGQTQSSSQKLAAFVPEYDNKTLSDLHAYINQKVPSVDSGSTGKANPFLR